MMLDMLERRRQEDEVKYGCVTRMLNAMYIKKHFQHDPQTQTMFGYVDVGDRLNETDIASEVLVFMVVGLQGGDLPSPFADIPAPVHDHSYLPVRYDGLVDNALVYISGFVVRRALKKLSCDVCRASLVTDDASAIQDQIYHLLCLRNNGGQVIPSEGTVRVVRAAEWAIRQASASFRPSQPIKLLEVLYIVRKRIGSEDVFVLREHIGNTQTATTIRC
ncbi:unnamed protein product [Arctogadus glacialis]